MDIEDVYEGSAQSLEPLELREGFDEFGSVVSYSSLTLHRKCPQAWLYRYGYRLEEDRDVDSPNRILGSWWSVLRAAEALARGRRKGSLKFVPEKLEVERDDDDRYTFPGETVKPKNVLESAEAYWKGLSKDSQDEFVEKLGEALPDRLRGMYRTWAIATEESRKNEAPVGVEVYAERELPLAEEDGPKIKLIAYLDEVYVDENRGMTVIRDHKALKSLSRDTGSIDDMMDSQLQLYAWVATPMIKAAGLKPPRAVGYDRTRSTAPKTPQLTASGGLSKAVTDYDVETYLSWATTDERPWVDGDGENRWTEWSAENGLTPEQAKEVRDMPSGPIWGKPGEFYVSGAKKGKPKFGTYAVDDKIVEELSSPSAKAKWHTRTLTPIQTNVVRAHLRSAVDSATEIKRTAARAQRDGEAARNFNRQTCGWCEFQPICQAQMVGGPKGEYDLGAMGLRVRPVA